jgi:hypothetical protein
MSVPVSWQGKAFNPVPASENRIHGDDVARAYGFRGGLVPGVVVSAYLAHPAAVAWGRDWLERGAAHVTVASPVYDGETFDVEVEAATTDGYRAQLLDARGTRCAAAEVSLPAASPAPPRRRGDPPLERGMPRAAATRAAFERMRETGLHALHTRWDGAAEIVHYLGDAGAVAPVFRETGLANPAFVLALSNWVLAANAKLDAWLHLETRSQSFRAIDPGAALVVEAAITDLFEKKAHHFVDVDVSVFDEPAGQAISRIELRAIYRLRGAPEAGSGG